MELGFGAEAGLDGGDEAFAGEAVACGLDHVDDVVSVDALHGGRVVAEGWKIKKKVS